MAQPEPTISVIVAQKNDQMGQTQGGKLKVGIKTQAGKWIQVVGGDVGKIQVGHELVITEPSQFGKQFYATLKAIRLPREAGAVVSTPSQPPPQPNGQDTQPPPPQPSQAQQYFGEPLKKLTWDEFARTMRAAYALAHECEPDTFTEARTEVIEPTGEPYTAPIITIDRSAARATVVCSVIIALTKDNGHIEPAPEDQVGEKAPF